MNNYDKLTKADIARMINDLPGKNVTIRARKDTLIDILETRMKTLRNDRAPVVTPVTMSNRTATYTYLAIAAWLAFLFAGVYVFALQLVY